MEGHVFNKVLLKLSSTLKLRNFETGMKMMAVAPHHWYVQPILAFNISFGVGYCFIHSKGNAKTRVWDKAISSCTFFVLSAFIWELGSVKSYITMLTFAVIFYIFMCFISNWNLIWPITMLISGGLGDKAIAIIWAICLIIGLG